MNNKRAVAKWSAVAGISMGTLALITLGVVYVYYPGAFGDQVQTGNAVQAETLKASLHVIFWLSALLIGTSSATLAHLASERRDSN